MSLFEDEFKNAPGKDTTAQVSFDESSAYLLPKFEIPEFQERDLDTFSDQAKARIQLPSATLALSRSF